jgi:formiminotetrahydrofolate cyclodeaminase
VAADTVTPGGGAVAAAAGALAAALAEMVARLTVGKKKYADVEAQMAAVAEEAASLRAGLLAAVDEDIAAFNALMEAYRLPKEDPARPDAVQTAVVGAADVPLRVARIALEAMKLAGQATAVGNLNAITDGMAGVHMALAAVEIAALNVRINAASMTDPATAARYSEAASAVVSEARTLSAGLLTSAAARANLTL